MAKDMSKVYADMLTKELVALRARHTETYQHGLASTSRKVKQQGKVAKELVAQIDRELADRVANFNLFV